LTLSEEVASILWAASSNLKKQLGKWHLDVDQEIPGATFDN
jgi:hypothetical protein